MYQAIQTKYFGPSNVRGSHVKASCDAGTLWHRWDHSKNTEGNHREAARKLAEKLGWSGIWTGGGLPGSGYAFVLADGDCFAVVDKDQAA